MRLYSLDLSTHVIGKKFNTTHKTVCNHLRKLGVQLRHGGVQPRAIKTIQLDENLAYVLGVIGPGDGFKTTRTVGLEVADREFAEEFKKRVEEVTGLRCAPLRIIKPNNPNHRRRYKVQLNSVKFVQFLDSFGVSFREKDWRVPSAIKQDSTKICSAYLRAFVDSQAWVETKSKVIGICVKNLVGLKEVQELFEKLGMQMRFYLRKKACVMAIMGWKNLGIFATKIGFGIKRKQEKLIKILKSYKLYRTPTAQINKLVPQMTQLRTQGLSYAKIAKHFGISKPAVHKRLRFLPF